MSKDSFSSTTACAIAALGLRLFLGLRFMTAALGKFRGEDGYSFSNYLTNMGGMVENMSSNTILPAFMVAPYAYPLGIIQFILGILLLLGFRLTIILPATLAMFLSLILGQMLLGNNDTVTSIALHILITVVALLLLKHDRFRIDQSQYKN